MYKKVKLKKAALTGFAVLFIFQLFGLITSCHKPEWSKGKNGGNKVMYGCVSTEYKKNDHAGK